LGFALVRVGLRQLASAGLVFELVEHLLIHPWRPDLVQGQVRDFLFELVEFLLAQIYEGEPFM
jgi:hypothetical protein